MVRSSLAVLAITVLICGCSGRGGASQASGAPESNAASSTGTAATPEVTDWDRASTDPKPELCPDDADPTLEPTFRPPEDAQRDGFSGLVQHGVVANKQGELFRIDVTGPDATKLKDYTGAPLKVCLDYLLAEPRNEKAVEGSAPEEPPAQETFGKDPDDLVTEVQVLGFVKPGDAEGVVAELAGQPVDQWNATLKEKNATPEATFTDAELTLNYLIDFVIDPLVGSGTHQYQEKFATRVWVRQTAASGHELGGLCRSSWSPFKRFDTAVNVDGFSNTAAAADSQTNWYLYDLAVRGRDGGGRYRVAGTWGWAGWFADYWSSPPTGSYRYCFP